MYIGIAYQIIYLGIVNEYWQASIGLPETEEKPF
jgi:hypothetical protein